MKLLRDCWAALLELFHAVTLSPVLDQSASQHVLQPGHDSILHKAAGGGPVFSPPSHPQNPDDVIQCDYSAMGKEWVSCSTSHSRSCWLAGPAGQQFDILTDYEKRAPIGKLRKVLPAPGLCYSHVLMELRSITSPPTKRKSTPMAF